MGGATEVPGQSWSLQPNRPEASEKTAAASPEMPHAKDSETISSTTPTGTQRNSLEGLRAGSAGRLFHPARPAFPRTSTPRISHLPDPRERRYARPDDKRRKPRPDVPLDGLQ